MTKKTEVKKQRVEPKGYICKDTTKEPFVPPDAKVENGYVHGLSSGLHSFDLRNIHGVPVPSSMKMRYGTGVDLNEWKGDVGRGYSLYADGKVCAHLDRDIYKEET